MMTIMMMLMMIMTTTTMMVVQAWRLHKVGGRMPAQGWGASMLNDLALAEANMMGDEYRGMADLHAKKLEGIHVADEDRRRVEAWAAKVRSGVFGDMLASAEAISQWCGEREAIGSLANLAPMLANAVRFVRLGGSSILVSLAEAQDVLIKRACASALFAIFSDELPRLELAKCDVRWTQALVSPPQKPPITSTEWRCGGTTESQIPPKILYYESFPPMKPEVRDAGR